MAEEICVVTVPKLGLTMREGTVAAWRVTLGGSVRKGDPIADIETEKITAECEAPADGVLRRVIAEAGTTLPVGAAIGVIAAATTSEADIDARLASTSPA